MGKYTKEFGKVFRKDFGKYLAKGALDSVAGISASVAVASYPLIAFLEYCFDEDKAIEGSHSFGGSDIEGSPTGMLENIIITCNQFIETDDLDKGYGLIKEKMYL